MNHFANNGKEYLKKKRQYRSNQGRSPERVESTYKGCMWALLIFLIVLAIVLIIT